MVRIVGSQFNQHYTDFLSPEPVYNEEFKRTVNVWGKKAHSDLARTRIGIVGLGSVGSVIAETLARMGMQKFVLIDFDEVQAHNLDRLLGASRQDIGQLKIDIAHRQIRKAATAEKIEVNCVPKSLAEESGYRAALDCDVLFSCVDRPRPRNILNHIAYNHLIPVIDGGIRVRMPEGIFEGVDWQLQTVGPSRICLRCIKAYNPSDVSLEIEGKLDDPSYLAGLPNDHHFKTNENIFPFSASLASLEVMQLIALVTKMGGIDNFGKQRFRYRQGVITASEGLKCNDNCDFQKSVACGDRDLVLYGKDLTAIIARNRQAK